MRRLGRLCAGIAALVLFAGAPLEAQAQRPSPEETRRRVEEFRGTMRAFALDLREARPELTVTQTRRIAYMATSEAMRHNVPPALVFGIMLQETCVPNRKKTRCVGLDPHAVSIAGARGLMQIMPKIWLPQLGEKYGTDLFDIETNIRFGVHIARVFLVAERGDWYRAMARYSGKARRYSEKVESHVLRHARRLCPTRDYESCVAGPARAAFGR